MMLVIVQILLLVLICISTFFFVYESVLSRREDVPSHLQLRHRARMNIHMGILFLSISLLHLTSSSTNWIRYVLIGVIAIIGVVNLYYGIKNHSQSKQIQEDSSKNTSSE